MTVVPGPGGPPSATRHDPLPQLLRDLLHERVGLYFDDDRLDMMLDKLKPRLAALNCPTFLDYYYRLKYDEANPVEWRRVMDAYSVLETYFWRESDQIDALVKRVVPAWFRDSMRPLRIWSAACASGEEPYSLAIALQENGWGSHPIEILASDASEAALDKARSRQYRERSFRNLPVNLRQKYFQRKNEVEELDPAIAGRVRFFWANLMDLGAVAEVARVDVIFCRNVFIYFSPASIRQVAGEFAQRLPAGGKLFIGASESLLKVSPQFDLEELNGAFVYVRNQVR